MSTNSDQRGNEGESVRQCRNEEQLWRKCIIVSGNVLALACVGFNYGLWPLIADLRTFNEGTELDPKWIVYTNIAVTGLSALIACLLTLRLGTRKVVFTGAVLSTTGLFVSALSKSVRFSCFTYGGITGVGYGFTLSPSLALLFACFNNRRGLLYSVPFLGTAASLSALPLLICHVTEAYSRSSVFLILAATNAHLAVFATLFKSPRHRTGNTGPRSLSSKSIKDLVSSSKRQVFLASMFFVGAAFNTFVLHLPEIFKDNGVEEGDLTWLMMACGVSVAVGLTFTGLTGLCKKNEGHYASSLLMISTLLAAIAGFISMLPKSLTALYILSAGIGLSSGVYLPSLFILMECNRSLNTPIPASLGVGLLLFAVGALIGMYLGDFLIDATDYLYSSYILSAVMMVIVFALLFLTRRSKADDGPQKEGESRDSDEDRGRVEANLALANRPAAASVDTVTRPSANFSDFASILGKQNTFHINEFHVHLHGPSGDQSQATPVRAVSDVKFKRFLSLPKEIEF
ncbi:monocarboxylate transporter 13-like [Ptychodera flava]|uniref:monocarboxylate transporter 13-like n=1 Tax=Ptychodera flava TaxID=63121 RepID=UPI00396A8C97